MHTKQQRRFYLFITAYLRFLFLPSPTTQQTSCGPGYTSPDQDAAEFEYLCGTVFIPCPQEDAAISCIDPSQATPAPFTPTGSSATQFFALTAIEDLAKGVSSDIVTSSSSTGASGVNTVTSSRLVPGDGLGSNITPTASLPAPTRTNAQMSSGEATGEPASAKGNNNTGTTKEIGRIVGGVVAAVVGAACVGGGMFLWWRRRRRGLKRIRIPSGEIFEVPATEIQGGGGSRGWTGSWVYTYGGREIRVIRGAYERRDGVDDRGASTRRWTMYI